MKSEKSTRPNNYQSAAAVKGKYSYLNEIGRDDRGWGHGHGAEFSRPLKPFLLLLYESMAAGWAKNQVQSTSDNYLDWP